MSRSSCSSSATYFATLAAPKKVAYRGGSQEVSVPVSFKGFGSAFGALVKQ
jgi:hypothetical protein